MIKPLRGHVVVEQFEKQQVTSTGIVLPTDVISEDRYEGTVIRVGEPVITDKGKTIPPVLKEGDKVLFGKYGFSEIMDGDKKYLLMKEENVFGFYKP